MQFLDLWNGFLSALSSFLLTEPISGFVGIFLLFGIWGLVRKMITINK